ncbi:MAG: hypothetical protein A2086_01470 [Spirochaetes bacterium GWD1_27_9]|nr:MAG: hypothetical protein A2Z98_13130 [Spirochaetes bacterium GWB1_27_13]OHD23184.1 MAG: hypothetical protein A2Y34_15495 [Spirochaetes bacterium GWC1_27_15]OHD42701.1 MAG: hypothetical protein A2086_01470 [Spirochaetes bacterium GWD1_27_9]
MSDIIRKITNIIYNSNSIRKKYLLENPSEKIIMCDASKSVKLDEDKTPEYGKEWITAKRCVFIFSDKKIKAGKWEIPINQIDNAELIKFSTLYGKGMVLKISTIQNEYYQFGLQYNKEIENQNILNFKISEQKLKLSLFSIIIRIIAISFLIYYIITKFIIK